MSPLDELYLEWLVDQVVSAGTRHSRLLEQLFTTEFAWFVPNDDNRAEDGISLRVEFWAVNNEFEMDSVWMAEPCSILEMMVALARRMAFESDGDPEMWFWIMVKNLGLNASTDKAYARDDLRHTTVGYILEALVGRTYQPNGLGGLFPLRYPDQDQREVELWYQQGAYILENE